MKKKLTLIVLSILIIITVVVGISYAYWQTTKVSTTNNLLKSSCFKLEIQRESDSITLNKTYPITDEEALEGSVSPYYFILKNTCDLPAMYDVNLEVLPSSTLDSKYIKSYTTASSEFKILNEYELMDNTIIEDAKEGRILASEKLMPGESSMFGIALWLDENTPAIPETINQTFESKITLNGSVQEDFVTINLDTDGGELEYYSYISKEGNEYGYLPTPIKKGYHFSHWYMNNEDNIITEDTIIKGKNNITIKAAYTKVENIENIALAKEEAFELLVNFKEIATEIKPYNSIPSNETLQNAVDISDEVSYYKVYAWMEDTILYYYSEKDIYLQNDSFKLYENVTYIDLSNIYTTKMDTMEEMFYHLEKLVTIDISNFDTSNVRNMRGMFERCKSLINLDLSSFNTTNVTNMASMFDECLSLQELNISSFDTQNVTSMSFMFHDCSKLAQLYLLNFNTSNVENMTIMFDGCESLQELDLRSFNTQKVKNMYMMFSYCLKLETINISGFNTSNVEEMGGMFSYCKQLKNLDLSNFYTSNVTNMSNMFLYCESLTQLDLSNFNTDNVTDMSKMFKSCNSLTNLNISNFNTSKVENMFQLFNECENLENLNLSHFNTSNVTNMSDMFKECTKLKNVDVSNFNTSKVENMEWMFMNCKSLTELNLSSFDTGNVTNMSWMFYGCDNIKRLDLSNFNTEKVTEFKDILPLFTLEELILNCESASNLKTFIDNDNVYNRYISYTCI